MKLYYSPLSVYSAKPRIAMFEKAIAHETQLVNWTPATGWIKPDELPRLNPKAQIPVLVDGAGARGGRTHHGRAPPPVPAARTRAGQARLPVRRIQRRRHLVLLADQYRVVDGGRAGAGVWQPVELADADAQPAERSALPGGIRGCHSTAESVGTGGSARID